MTKMKKTINKNAKKEKPLKIKEEDQVKDQIITALKILVALLVFILVLVLITKFVNGDFKSKKVRITYNDIIAGQTFNRKEKTYYVVYYSFNSDTSIQETIDALKTEAKVYKVNLDDGMNKDYISEKGNSSASSVGELKINGVTLIKIEEGKNIEYVEGSSNVETYLKNM